MLNDESKSDDIEYTSSNSSSQLIFKIYGWEFLFYNKKPTSNTRLYNYIKMVQNVIAKYQSLENAISNPSVLANLKKNAPIGKSNSNSVIMYHAPISSSAFYYGNNNCCHRFLCFDFRKQVLYLQEIWSV